MNPNHKIQGMNEKQLLAMTRPVSLAAQSIHLLPYQHQEQKALEQTIY